MTTVSTNGQQHDQGAFGDDFTSPFVPIGVTAALPTAEEQHRRRPEAVVVEARDADRARAQGIFISSLVISFIGLIFQVQIPNEVGQAIDDGLKKGGTPLSQFVIILVVLGLLRFVCNYFSRLLLLRTAYRIEYDLRNIVYEHLSRMSFSFYDRVQSGQLISRANSDIRCRADVPVAGAVHPRAVQRRRSSRSRRCCRSTFRSRSWRCRRCRSCSSPA